MLSWFLFVHVVNKLIIFLGILFVGGDSLRPSMKGNSSGKDFHLPSQVPKV